MAKIEKIALIGGGNMGGALAAGWLRGGKRSKVAAENLIVVDPAPGETVQKLAEKHDVTVCEALSLEQADTVDLVVLAIKVQSADTVAAHLKQVMREDTPLLSTIAGVSLHRLAIAFGDRPIMRAIPNTASEIGAGVTVCVANEAGDTLEAEITRLLKGAGSVEWVQDERLIGTVGAVSGAGPAYVFLLAEALEGAGVAEGLPRDLAARLARETIVGAGALLASSDKSPQELRRAVTPVGGTAQAALDVLMGNGGGLPELVRQAVAAAERRSRQLASGGGRGK
ncbi:MAG: pyrroline-5-carboxylate reductase [Pseudomonadota bacterium]|nr:pyrroline-5-carboxylate reductase [Pseudomonadota bacterium]